MPSKFSQQLEELTETLTRFIPKPLLPAAIILVAIAVYFVLKPPHTICDTLKDNLAEKQAGILFPTRVNKKTYPGKIQSVMEGCRFGNSAGACFEYFNILRRVALSLKESTPECIPDILELSIGSYAKTEYYESVGDGDRVREELADVRYVARPLSVVLQDGLEMMVLKAWGEFPPEPGPARLGWFQESELATFCHLQDVLRRAKGSEGWADYVRSVMAKLPGEKPVEKMPGAAPPAPPRRAPTLIPEAEIKQRSLFSVNCASYR